MVSVKPSRSNLVKGKALNAFYGHIQGINPLNYPFGVLALNQNMEYLYSGGDVYVQTRRGSTFILDIGRRPYGAANYVYNSSTEFLIWADNQDLRQYNFADGSTGIVSSGDGSITGSTDITFVMYGQGTNAALFGCDSGDSSNSIFKITGSTPTYASITSPANISHIAFSSVAGRIFGVAGHNVLWTQQQATTGIGNISDWQVGTNTQPVSPDDGIGFKCSLDMGQAHFFWKDTGIWCLLNSELSVAQWLFPKCNADTGTLSPKTVKLVKYGNRTGAIYLGSDKTLRFFNGSVTRNAGNVPTLEGGDSKNISQNFQVLLDVIPTDNQHKATGFYWKGLYFLVYPTGQTSDVDACIVVDTDKLMKMNPGDDIAQPFWYTTTNMEWVEFVHRKSTQELYGFHKEAYISKLFVDDLYTDGVPSRIDSTGTIGIPWLATIGWYRYAQNVLELIEAYVSYGTDQYGPANFVINAFTQGDGIPTFQSGFSYPLTPSLDGTAFWNVSQWGIGLWGTGDSARSQGISQNNYGHFFSFSLYNNNKGEWAAWYGVDPIFKSLTSDSVGTRG